MPATADYWTRKIKRMLKAELKARDITYGELVARLSAIGIIETEYNIRNKLSRGRFSAVFFVQCLIAIEAQYIYIMNDMDE